MLYFCLPEINGRKLSIIVEPLRIPYAVEAMLTRVGHTPGSTMRIRYFY